MSNDNSRTGDNNNDCRQKNGDPANNTEPLIVTIEPQTKNKHSYPAKQYRLDRARFRLEKKAYCAAHWTMIFLIAYTGLTFIVACASVVATIVSYSQATLNERVLEGANAAVIKFLAINNLGNGFFEPHLRNQGKVISPRFVITYDVVAFRMPDGKVSQIIKHDSRRAFEVMADGTGENDIVFSLSIPESVQAFNGMTTFGVKGTFTYDNGFKRNITEDFCWIMVPDFQRIKTFYTFNEQATWHSDCTGAQPKILEFWKQWNDR